MPSLAFADFVAQARSGAALASFPTDTVPALASRPDQSDLIYAAKARPADKPLILMGAAWSDLQPFVAGTAIELAAWRTTAERYWPGALTLVLPASDRVPVAMNPQQTGTIGIRVPAHALARHILSATGPLATTSVNRSGQPALERMADIALEFPDLVQLSEAAIADLKPTLASFSLQGSGLPSTVALWEADGWRVVRQGTVRLED